MHRTFVPDEALLSTRSILIDPAKRHSKSPAGRSEFLGTPRIRYDLFRSRHEPELYCAVPENRPSPAFIQLDQWQAAGQMDEATPAPLGFNREAARIGIHLNGFYLFVAFSPIPALKSDRTDHPPLRPARKVRAQAADGMLSPLENPESLSLHQTSQGS
jgi:hypothetical protein